MTSIDPTNTDEFEELMVDKEALPDVYVGELVDIDGDSEPDLALFGDPTDPTLRPLRSEGDGLDWAPVAIVVAATIAAGATHGSAAMKKRADD